MALAVLLSLAIVTHSPSDDRLLVGGDWNIFLEPGSNPTNNLLGPIGAVLSRSLVTELLGFPVLVLVGLLFLWGYVLLRQRKPVFLPFLTSSGIAVTLFASCFLGWFDVRTEANLTYWSGSVGRGIAEWLEGFAGSIGSFAILAVGLIVILLLVIDRDIQGSLDRAEKTAERIKEGIATGWTSYRQGAAERKEQREKRRAERRAERQKTRKDRDAKRKTHEKKHGASPRPDRDAPRPADDRGPARSGQSEPSLESDPDLEDIVENVKHGGPAFNVHRPAENEPIDLDKTRSPSATDLPYDFPSIELLKEPDTTAGATMEEIEENKQILLDTLTTHNVDIAGIDAVVGPTVTRYELVPAPGIKLSRITSLEDNLAMSLAAQGIRIIAPIPGKGAVGIEIPNQSRELVVLRQMLSTTTFRDAGRGNGMALPVPIGKTIEGDVFIEDLARMPHLLIAGATGAGKSVGLNAMITGLLYAKRPADLKFVMIDPKKIELNGYRELDRHFVARPEDSEEPIITDFLQAGQVLRSLEDEMEHRYDLLSEAGARNIEEYNEKFGSGMLSHLDPDEGHQHLPYIVVVIDELADLMLTNGKEVEAPIARLAQMARAVGIHLVIATQRPSVDVITGTIKANFPSRIAYQTSSTIDSRTIIDGAGAEQLIGNGDLLYMNGSRITRLQGPYVSADEVDTIVGFVRGQKGAGAYLLPPMETEGDRGSGAGGSLASDRDELFEEAARVIVRSQHGSVSMLQRKLSVGYTRAARIVDQLEEAGIVGQFEGSKAREVLVPDVESLETLLSQENEDQDV